MSGFRSKAFEARAHAMGWKVVSTVVKDCALLVVQDVDAAAASHKVATARARGIPIVTVDAFLSDSPGIRA